MSAHETVHCPVCKAKPGERCAPGAVDVHMQRKVLAATRPVKLLIRRER